MLVTGYLLYTPYITITHWKSSHNHSLEVNTQSLTGSHHTITHWKSTHNHSLEVITQSLTGSQHTITHWKSSNNHSLEVNTQSLTGSQHTITHWKSTHDSIISHTKVLFRYRMFSFVTTECVIEYIYQCLHA